MLDSAKLPCSTTGFPSGLGTMELKGDRSGMLFEPLATLGSLDVMLYHGCLYHTHPLGYFVYVSERTLYSFHLCYDDIPLTRTIVFMYFDVL